MIFNALFRSSTALRFSTAIFIVLLGACSFFEPHKVPVQQGNIVTQKMIDQLQPGMNKSQVKFILGSPLLVDPLHANQWHYTYSVHLGTELLAKYQLTLHFDNDLLSSFNGDFKPSEPVDTENNKSGNNDNAATENNTVQTTASITK
jgi:outer membrane protein assembly factor BamE